MKTVFLIFSLFCCISLTCEAQETTQTYPAMWEVNYNLATPWHFNPRHRIGFEYHNTTTTIYSVYFGFGEKDIVPHFISEDEWENDYHLWEIRPAIKSSLIRTDTEQFYVSLEGFFIKQKAYVGNSSFQYYGDGTYYRAWDSEYKKVKLGINTLFGLKARFARNVMFDIYGGAGLAYGDGSYSNADSDPAPYQNEYDLVIPPDIFRKAGTGFTVVIAIGARLGGVFLSHKSVSKSELD